MALSTVKGGLLDELLELKSILAAEIDMCESARDLAALSRQYREVVRDIDEIQNGEDGDDRAAQLVKRHRKPEQPAAD